MGRVKRLAAAGPGYIHSPRLCAVLPVRAGGAAGGVEKEAEGRHCEVCKSSYIKSGTGEAVLGMAVYSCGQ